MTPEERTTLLFKNGCNCAAPDIGVGILHEPGCGFPRPEDVAQAIASAIAEMREACCKAVCAGCRYGVELVKTWTHNEQSYELWLHINREYLAVTSCEAVAIRARQP